jgi:apolipoprotein N-acyltransferase
MSSRNRPNKPTHCIRTSKWTANPFIQRAALIFVGGLFPLGFAPIDLWPLTFISLLIIVHEVIQGEREHSVTSKHSKNSKETQSQSSKETKNKTKRWLHRLQPSTDLSLFWVGFYWSLGAFGFGVSWVYVSIHEFGHVPVVGAAMISLLFVLLLSAIKGTGFKLIGLLSNVIGRRFLILIVPFCWVLFDFVQSHIFSGFPWLFAGYSQLDGPLSLLSTWIGVYGVTWFMLIICCVIVELLACFNDPKRIAIKPLSLTLILSVLLTLPVIVYVSDAKQPAAENRTASNDITVALVQPNVSQTIKWNRRYFGQIMDILYSETEQHWKSDLIVWPEGAIPAYKHQVEDIVFDLENRLKKNKSELLLGLPVYDKQQSLSFSAMYAVGREQQTYHKQVLVPFGEYVPLGQLIRGLMDFLDMPMSDFSPAISPQQPINFSEYSVIPAICYEIAYPGIIHELVSAAVQGSTSPKLLVTISNDAWFGDSFGPYQHMQMARMRALELGMPLVRSTNDGITAVVDLNGKVLKQLDRFTQGVLLYDVNLENKDTVYRRFGLSGIYSILVLSGFIFLTAWISRRRLTA